jgi:hypothetical protein
MRDQPNFAPDGYTTRQPREDNQSTQHQLARAAETQARQHYIKVWHEDDQHDEGLVHNHGWAKSSEH